MNMKIQSDEIQNGSLVSAQSKRSCACSHGFVRVWILICPSSRERVPGVKEGVTCDE